MTIIKVKIHRGNNSTTMATIWTEQLKVWDMDLESMVEHKQPRFFVYYKLIMLLSTDYTTHDDTIQTYMMTPPPPASNPSLTNWCAVMLSLKAISFCASLKRYAREWLAAPAVAHDRIINMSTNPPCFLCRPYRKHKVICKPMSVFRTTPCLVLDAKAAAAYVKLW